MENTSEDSKVSPLLKLMLLPLTVCLPMGVMMILFAKDFLTVGAEMTRGNISSSIIPMSFAVIFFCAGLQYTLYLKKHEKSVSLAGAAALLVFSAAALIVSLALAEKMRPPVEPFILPFGRWIMYFAMFYMSAIAYAIVIVSVLLKGMKWTYAALVSVFGVPFIIYLITVAASKGRSNILPYELWPFVVAGVLVGLGIIFSAAIVRLVIFLWAKCEAIPKMRLVWIFLVALAGPVCGLLLNRRFQFPADLQCMEVYALVVLNALVLCLGVFGSRKLDLAGVFLRGAVYPFSLYFFLLFLPWLPVFPMAVIAFGAGFLILTPALLFIMQNKIYASDFSRILAYTEKWKLVTAFVLGLAVMPSIFIAGAFKDHAQLDSLVNYYYHSPYVMPFAEQEKYYNPVQAEKILNRLKAAREGAEYPFISELYNRIVFSSLVLSKDRIDRMYSELASGEFEVAGNPFNMSFYSVSSSRMPPLSALRNRESRDAKLDVLTMTGTPEGARLTASIIGEEDIFDGEYVAYITIPEGVFVSGMSLKIDGNFVKGRMTERKSAFWIYEKITDARRDPALLSYENRNTLRLLVFPVTGDEKRELTLDFLYPEGVAPMIVFDGRECRLPAYGKSGGIWKYIGKEELASLPAANREQELLFVIDRSETDAEAQKEIMKEAFEKYPAAKTFRIASGVASCGGVSGAYPVSELDKAYAEYAKEYKPSNGGFALQNVLKGALLAYRDATRGKSLPVMITVSQRAADGTFDLTAFADIVPEYPFVIFGKDFSAYSILEKRKIEKCSELAFRDVRKNGDSLYAPDDGGAVVHVKDYFQSDAPRYTEALALFKKSQTLSHAPDMESELLSGLVKSSRESGILVPQTACIVLETEAQWKTLEDAEKKKLSRSSAFDIEEVETPEPPPWLISLIAILFAILIKALKKRKKDALLKY